MDAIKVTTNCDGRDRCHHREALKLFLYEPLKRGEEGRGDQLCSHKWPCQRAKQERCEGVVSITTILTPQQQQLLS